MKLEEIRKCAEALEMFGPDGFPDMSMAVTFGQSVLDLLKVAETARGMRDHGNDLRNGTHANLLWHALAALEADS